MIADGEKMALLTPKKCENFWEKMDEVKTNDQMPSSSMSRTWIKTAS